MVDVPSGRFVSDVDQWNSSKSTPDFAVVSDLQLLPDLKYYVDLLEWVYEGYTHSGKMNL